MSSRAWAVALLLVLTVVEGVSAQIPIEYAPGSTELTRADLESLLEQYQEAIASPAYSGAVKDAARVNADRIRQRLQEGDLKVGDRVAITVQGEPNIPDTVAVEAGPQITLPLFGAISLAGVLRSEVQEHITQELGKTIHNPVVQAKALMRLSVQGAVRTPGFYVVPGDMLVSEAIMVAGGPQTNADLQGLRIERGTVRLVTGAAMEEALLEGRTLDQLSLQAGDQLFVPPKASKFGTILKATGVVSSLVWIVFRFFR